MGKTDCKHENLEYRGGPWVCKDCGEIDPPRNVSPTEEARQYLVIRLNKLEKEEAEIISRLDSSRFTQEQVHTQWVLLATVRGQIIQAMNEIGLSD